MAHEELDKDIIQAAKDIKNERRRQAMSTAFKFLAKNAMPKGIRHPDSLVTNKHLYFPGVRGPKKTKLF